MSLPSVTLSATGLFIPPYAISNDELVHAFNQYVHQYNQQYAQEIAAGARVALVESSSEFIKKASGIKSRYVMEKEGVLNPQVMCPYLPERSNDELSIQAQMGVAAAQEALDRAGVTAKDIDMVLLASSNMQRAYPAVSIEIQAALGIEGFAFDMNVACSSATFAIQTAYNAIVAGNARRVLVVNVEICSAHVNFRERDSHFIFGDAATAMVFENSELRKDNQGFNVKGSALMTQFSNHIRNNFGFLNRCDAEHQFGVDKLFIQNGRKVFKEVCPAVGEHIVRHLQALSIEANAIKRFWLHQANRTMNDLIARRILGRDATLEEAPIILDQYANTSSAGSIIALHLHGEGLASGDLGVLSSFGAGYSIGSVVLEKR